MISISGDKSDGKKVPGIESIEMSPYIIERFRSPNTLANPIG